MGQMKAGRLEGKEREVKEKKINKRNQSRQRTRWRDAAGIYVCRRISLQEQALRTFVSV